MLPCPAQPLILAEQKRKKSCGGIIKHYPILSSRSSLLGIPSSSPLPKSHTIPPVPKRSTAYYSIAHTAPPPPPKRRIFLHRRSTSHLNLGALPPADPPSGPDVAAACAATHHAELAEGSQEGGTAGNAAQHQHAGADGGHDVQVAGVLADGVAEDGPHAGTDAGADSGAEGGDQCEQRDRDRRELAVDRERAQEDQQEGGEGRYEKRQKHGVRRVLDR